MRSDVFSQILRFIIYFTLYLKFLVVHSEFENGFLQFIFYVFDQAWEAIGVLKCAVLVQI